MFAKFVCLTSLLLMAATAFSGELEFTQSAADGEPVAFRMQGRSSTSDAPLNLDKAVENRTFYDGSLLWYFQSASVIGSLSMLGYDSTDNGGTISRVTGCFYNESAFQRSFRATFSVRQFGATIQAITFSRFFGSMTVGCHTLTGFNAVVEPGEFEVVVSYNRAESDNFWLGLPVTTQGTFFDVQVGSQRPPTVTGTQGPLTVRGVGIEYRINVNDGPSTASLTELDALIVPGFAIDLDTVGGETTFFAVRNTSNSTVNVQADYYGLALEDEPLRSDAFSLNSQDTQTANVASDLTGLEVADGFARGLLIIREQGGTGALLEGDYFRVDSANDFATGGRLVKAGDFCRNVEVRFVDFGSGADFRILLARPPADGGGPAFSYTAFDEGGSIVDEGNVFSSNHLNFFDVEDFVDTVRFGTLVFDFQNSEAGWVSARYSAFGRFSVEVESACRDD